MSAADWIHEWAEDNFIDPTQAENYADLFLRDLKDEGWRIVKLEPRMWSTPSFRTDEQTPIGEDDPYGPADDDGEGFYRLLLTVEDEL